MTFHCARAYKFAIVISEDRLTCRRRREGPFRRGRATRRRSQDSVEGLAVSERIATRRVACPSEPSPPLRPPRTWSSAPSPSIPTRHRRSPAVHPVVRTPVAKHTCSEHLNNHVLKQKEREGKRHSPSAGCGRTSSCKWYPTVCSAPCRHRPCGPRAPSTPVTDSSISMFIQIQSIGRMTKPFYVVHLWLWQLLWAISLSESHSGCVATQYYWNEM